MKQGHSSKHYGTARGKLAGRGVSNGFRGSARQRHPEDRVSYRGHSTHTYLWVRRAKNRLHNKIARISRKRNRPS